MADRSIEHEPGGAKPSTAMSVLDAVCLVVSLIKTGELLRATKVLAQVEGQVPQDAPRELRTTIASLRSDLMMRQGAFDEARAAILEAYALTDPDSPGRGRALLHEAAIELHAGRPDEAEPLLVSAAEIARSQGMAFEHAGALSNLGLIANLRGDEDRSVELWQEARRIYESLGMTDKIADCDHALGAALRQQGRDTDALPLLESSLAQAIVQGDSFAVQRRAGDLARTLMFMGPQHRERARELIGLTMDLHDELWSTVGTAELSVGARAERAAQGFNDLETAVSIFCPEDGSTADALNSFACITRAKGRIVREDLAARWQKRVEELRARSANFVSLNENDLAISAVPLVLKEVGRPHPSAFLDLCGFSAGRAFAVAHISSPPQDAETIAGWSRWPGAAADPLRARASRGDGHAAEARDAAARVLRELERYMKRATMMFDPRTGRADNEALDTMRSDAETLASDLQMLGAWMIPRALRLHFERHRIRHVFICPDPRLFNLPWSALVLDNGKALVDQPWTFTLLPSVLSLYDLRARRAREDGGVVVFAPDREVNEHLGGNAEIEHVARSFKNAEVVRGPEATVERLREAIGNGAWTHVRAHGGESLTGSYLPVLSDGLWESPSNSEPSRHGVLVAVCCKVGAGQARGLDIFGLVELAERSDTSAVVAPIISMDGVVAQMWMHRFYDSLAEDMGLAEACREAAKSTRNVLPHPAFWAPLIWVGDPTVRPFLPG